MRNLFPFDCFRNAKFGDCVIRALSPREGGGEGGGEARPGAVPGAIINEDAQRLVDMQEAAFEALEKGYLR